MKRWLSQIWISQWYLWSLWGSERDPWGDGWVLYHPREGMGRTNLRDFTVDRSQMIVPLFTYKNGG